MFERFTPDARSVVAHASEHARRLGHRYIGAEHILLAAVATSQPASEVMRAHGVTPCVLRTALAGWPAVVTASRMCSPPM